MARVGDAVLALGAAVVLVGAGYTVIHHPGPSSTPVAAVPPPVAVTSSTPTPALPPIAAKVRTVGADRAPVIDAIGSSLTEGSAATDFGHTWVWLTTQAINRYSTTKVVLNDHGAPGSDIAGIRQRSLAQVLADKPDVVFVEPGTPNNWGQNVPVQKAKDLTAQTVTDLRKALPGVFVVGVVPNDTKLAGRNGVGATFSDYVAGDREALAGADVTCDVYAAFQKDGRGLDGLLADKVHPNNAGHALWAQTMESCLGVG